MAAVVDIVNRRDLRTLTKLALDEPLLSFKTVVHK